MPIERALASERSPRTNGPAVGTASRLPLSSLALLIACLMAVLLLGAPVPDPRLTSDLKSDQGELSWAAVTLDSIARNARFGVDVVYTFGPLADLYIDQYHPTMWSRARTATIALLVLFASEFEWRLRTCSRNGSPPTALTGSSQP